MDLSVSTLFKSLSFLFWGILYLWFALKRNPDESPEWCSRAVTLLHGSVAAVAGTYQCGLFSLTRCRLMEKTMHHHYALMVWSWGYFAFDLLWCLIYWTDNKLMLFHHFSALSGINTYMGKENHGCAFACALGFMEITNPLLQARWFLRHHGYNETILFKIIEVTYLMLFLTVRGVLGTYLIVKIMGADFVELPEKLFSLVLYFISIAFIYEIIGYVLYKYKTKLGEFEGFLVEMGIILDEHT
ncbi:transmembrane protein 136-like [Hyposmocoma kahamanoa]|uniref:transmembrane protein 136-like n=1 Tax=Hyposmocoma kahamanoa TaxID=1477025 RepID=UPI000E6D966C|nr:transmembrane protein 136-like [Hyposmocoma kahamanoa]